LPEIKNLGLTSRLVSSPRTLAADCDVSVGENAAKPVQVNDVAQHAGVSRRVLERRFMQVLERTVAEEIRRVHFELAKKLLVETDLAIPEVADAAGFGTPRPRGQGVCHV
jgi:LacI family transcriptional regulator